MLSAPSENQPASFWRGRPAIFVWALPGGVLLLAVLLLFFLSLTGCENPGTGIIDPSGQPPFIASARVDPEAVDLRNIPPSGDQYPVSLTIRADISAPVGAALPLSVTATILPPEAGFPFVEVGLRDDGAMPDSVAGDGTYSGTLSFDILATEAGRYRVRVIARSANGFESNSREHVLFITRNNAPPVLSELTAPDTVNAPTTERLLIAMSARADDPDGAEDVREVYFRSLDSSDPTRKFFLKDDGDVAGSGDRVAGDGLYSIIVELLPGTPSRTYRFAFQAEDTFQDTSNTLLHYLTVR
jgi:hypothetical protein